LKGDEHLQPLHDMYLHFLKGVYRLTHSRYYRSIGENQLLKDKIAFKQIIDATVFDRWQKTGDYRPSNLTSWAVRAGCNLASHRGDFAF
jgi:hypothetical protein